jgi:hypothetical protein
MEYQRELYLIEDHSSPPNFGKAYTEPLGQTFPSAPLSIRNQEVKPSE